jgi:hypothetical protein
VIGRLILGTACLLLAVFTALLARDVWHAQKALHDGDARVEAGAGTGTWAAAPLLPFDAAEKVLGIQDDIAYRTLVVRAIGLARKPARSPEQARARAPVETALRRLEQDESDAKRAAQAAVVLGVLVYSDPEDPRKRVETPAQKAVGHFATAARLDPANDDAKRLLELVLQQERTQSPRGQAASGGGNRPGKGAAGLAPPGGGY